MSASPRWRGVAVASACLVLLMAALGPLDLPVMRAVAQPDHPFARMVRRFGEWPGWAAVIAAVVASRKGPAQVRRASRATWTLALVHPLLVTQSLKRLWGRVRYVDLPGSPVGYTPWWRPAGPGAGESFPSGHVAMATVVLPFAILLIRRGGRARAAGLALAAWPVVVAAGRVVAGAHYPTDVLASLGLGCILAGAMAEPRADRAPDR